MTSYTDRSGGIAITTLAPFKIERNGKPVIIKSQKALALLCYLAVEHKPVTRQALAGLLWPNTTEQNARSNLRTQLVALRNTFGDALHISRTDIAFHNDTKIWLDADQVEQASHKGSPRHMQVEAVALYQNDFLDGFSILNAPEFEQWVVQKREALRLSFVSFLRKLAVPVIPQQSIDALRFARRWVEHDRFNEEAHQQLILLLIDNGQRTEALAQFELCRQLLDRELSLAPNKEIDTLYSLVLNKERETLYAMLYPVNDLIPEVDRLALEPTVPRANGQLILIKKMLHIWVDRILTPLRQQDKLLDLHMQFSTDVIQHPWADVMEKGADLRITNIKHAFEHAEHALLILGEPGAGKSLILIRLAEQLLTDALQSIENLIPVILNLSTWPESELDLDEWVVDEMVVKYQIPRRMGRKWLKGDKLLLMLDGLDEVDFVWRGKCIEAINHFRQEYGLADLVVTCRQKAYQEAVEHYGLQLLLQGAVQIQPLTPEHIHRIAPPNIAQTIMSDPNLYQIARSPLALSMLQNAFAHDPDTKPTEMQIRNFESSSNSPNAAFDNVEKGFHKPFKNQQELIEFYIQQMLGQLYGGAKHTAPLVGSPVNRFEQKKKPVSCSQEQLMHLLKWLAGRMVDHHQTLFFIEELQPSWLSRQRVQWIYLISSRMLIGLFFGVPAFWGVVQMIRVNPPNIAMPFLTRIATLFGAASAPWDTLTALTIITILASIIFSSVTGISLIYSFGKMGMRKLLWFINPIAIWAMISMLLSLFGEPLIALYFGAILVVGSCTATGYFNRVQNFRNDIRNRTDMQWSWPAAWTGAAIGAAVGLSWSLVLFLQEATSIAWLINILQNVLLFALIGGISGKQPEEHNRPNEGMRIALRNGLKAVLLVGIIPSLFVWLTINGETAGYFFLTAACFGAAAHGGIDLLNHCLVRVLLWFENRIPFKITTLLDEATQSNLLHRVGGAYAFRHRLIQENLSQHSKRAANKTSRITNASV